MTTESNGHSHCDATRIVVHGRPLVRGYCHCTICQKFNQAAYADIVLFRARDVDFPTSNPVEFHAYKKPPLVQRGKCIACDHAAIEYLNMPLMPKLVMLPTANIGDDALVPEPSLHIFYDTRVADIDDGLPKYTGYLQCQLAFGRRAVAALMCG